MSALQHISNQPALKLQSLELRSIPQPDGKSIPKLFTSLKIRDVTFQNRIWYSAEDGHITLWHLSHLGGIISRGPGLSFVEASAVSPNDRITPEDVGIWDDSHIVGLKQIVDFAHSQGQKIGIQLAHAGRKASTVAPWLQSNYPATSTVGGWTDIVGPSLVPYAEVNTVPKELSRSEIKEIVSSWAEATKRAVRAGFDVIEIHNAHGYLLHSFNSPVSNKWTDEYGESFENRIRLSIVVDAIQAVIPERMPLFVKVSASDRMEVPNEPSWTLSDTVKLAPILSAHGVDLLDVSSAGLSSKQNPLDTLAHQKFSKAIKHALADLGDPMLVGTVGGIKSGVQAEGYLQDNVADVTSVGRQFQRNPALVWDFADELGIRVYMARALQMWWPFYGRASRLGSNSKN